MSILIISGISGSGKSLTCNTLEDLGYFCIDNLPPQLLLPVCRMQADRTLNRNLAVVVDSRSQNMFEDFNQELDLLTANGISYKLLFIYCDPDVILSRFKQTRRKHPLLEESQTLEEAINKEYELCKSIEERADYVIDTTAMKISQLKTNINEMFGEEGFLGMTIRLVSFGYRYGVPNEADLVFDVRCMPNPFYVPALRDLSGLDDEVYDYVFGYEQSVRMGKKIMEFITEFLPYYVEEGKSELAIACGCTSGHHRSVSFIRYIQEQMKHMPYRVIVVHRDVDKEF